MVDREQELLELMLSLDMALRREAMGGFRRNHSFMSPHHGQGRIITLLKLHPQISQKEICYLLGMSKQGLAELLSKLEAAGYITREQSTEDGRVMIVKLTEKGKRKAEEVESGEKQSDTIFSCLSIDEQETLRTILQRMMVCAEKNMPERFTRRRRHMHGGNK